MAGIIAALGYGRWEPGIGDPTFLGWFTVVAYFSAAALCVAAWRRVSAIASPRERFFWIGFAILLVLLGINKQLDLQTLFTEIGRSFARATGWYRERRIVQALFILLLAGSGVGLMALAWHKARHLATEYRVALVGMMFQVCFIIVRAASFHHMDVLLRYNIRHVRVNHMLELGGSFIIALAAWTAWRKQRSHFGPQGKWQFVVR